MKVPPTLSVVLGNLLKKPATNQFPKSEPVPTPEGFRGKLLYDKDKCIGCRLCITVCPAGVFEYVPEIKKVTLWLGRCVFCQQCVDVCPVNALEMSDEFLLATYDKYDDNLRWLKNEEIEKMIEEQKSKKVKKYRIIEDKCKGCTLCARKCPQDAISGSPGKIHKIDPKKCVGCGLCATVCRFGAIEEYEE
ncbi:hydrogenase [Palaeococcus pacificus DY20341]|uniref:Hydrogenase n=1 Tax=Palaeococcus pacificus DY20341 TaxID=1343739 RepID=A0A075LQV2_9EURY|nr:4Fe-4S binding protein [Palaeococcus pacificus]AIF68674.1 hydrogenase [Palaeococcus pacificus DY20341]